MTIYVVEIEPIPTRYTEQWKTHVPKQLGRHTDEPIVVIEGEMVDSETTPGMFLNFSATNIYKSSQMREIAVMFDRREIKDGDYFLYTDAWNPTVIQLKYMADLFSIDLGIGGMWHAGSYDSYDGLGRHIGAAPWVRHAERSMFECYTHNFFATRFHAKLFGSGVLDHFDGKRPRKDGIPYDDSIVITGWPMEYLKDELAPYRDLEKQPMILFPHRVAPEKQPEIFRDLSTTLPEYEWVMCQNQKLSKHEYHTMLGEATIVFSANLQETLGISWFEGCLVDTVPLVPNRLSYSEMAIDQYSYNERWTSSWQNYQNMKGELVKRIRDVMENPQTYRSHLTEQIQKLDSFFNGDVLYKTITSRNQ